MRHKGLSLISVILLLIWSAAAAIAGAPVEEVAKDLRPLSGVVIMPVGDEYLIDQDATAGVAIGDLFTVVRPGEKIIHPVTKAVLGTLDEIKAVLQVTRLKSGYSYARPLGAAKGVAPGDPVRRFSALPAVFWDYAGDGEAVFAALQPALPDLEWQDYTAAQRSKPATPQAASNTEPRLIFLRLGDRLEVRDSSFTMLRSYAWPVAKSVTTPAPPAAEAVPAPASPMIVPPAETTIIRPALPPAASPVIQAPQMTDDQMWTSQAVKGEAAGIEVGDFDGDRQLEIGVLYAHRLEIGRLTQGNYVILGRVEFGVGRKGVALDGADLDGDGKTELYVTAAYDGDLNSCVVGYREGEFRLIEEGIPWYFRALPLPGEGPSLLAQRMGGAMDDFAGPIFRIRQETGKLVEGETVAMPKVADLFNILPLNGGYARLTEFNHLQILDAEGESLWEDSQPMAGSEVYIEREDPSKNVQFADRTRNFYIKPHLAVGPQGEVLVPVNEGLRFIGRYRNFDSSYLLALAWDGQMLNEVWRTRTQKGYMVDFRLADADNDGRDEIVFALNYPTKFFSGERKSVLIAYEMP